MTSGRRDDIFLRFAIVQIQDANIANIVKMENEFGDIALDVFVTGVFDQERLSLLGK
jgi:hypothetical protein